MLNQPILVNLLCGVDGIMRYCTATSDPRNAHLAVVGRLLRARPTPDNRMMRLFREHNRRLSRLLADPYLIGDLPDYQQLFYWWIENTNYTRSRKQNFIMMYETFVRDNFDELMTLLLGPKCPKQKQYLKCKSFLKKEFLETEGKAPRSINARTDLIKMLIGPYIKKIEERTYDMTSRIGRFFFKHVKPDQAVDFLLERLVHDGMDLFESDFTNFEGSIKAETQMKCEFQYYQQMIGASAPRWVLNLIAKLMQDDCVLDFKSVSFTVKSMRMSGEMYTSLGNGITNLFTLHFACEQAGMTCPIDEFCAVVEGDDGLFNIPSHVSRERIQDICASLGFEIKLERHKDISTASFCGKMFDVASKTLMSDPMYVLPTSGVSFHHYKSSELTKALLTMAKGYSLAYTMRNCPLLHAWALRMIRSGACFGATPSKVKEALARNGLDYDVYHRSSILDALNVNIFKPCIADSARATFEKLFGIPINVQLHIEQRIDVGVGWLDLPELAFLCKDAWRRHWNDMTCVPLLSYYRQEKSSVSIPDCIYEDGGYAALV